MPCGQASSCHTVTLTASPSFNIVSCANYRAIALVSHASKILLRIILERIGIKTETEIADEQAGFRQGRGTRDQITNLRILMYKEREHQQPLFVLCGCWFSMNANRNNIREHT